MWPLEAGKLKPALLSFLRSSGTTLSFGSGVRTPPWGHILRTQNRRTLDSGGEYWVMTQVMMARQAALLSGGPLSGPVPSLYLHRTWEAKAEPCVSQNWYISDTPAGILTHTRAGARTPLCHRTLIYRKHCPYGIHTRRISRLCPHSSVAASPKTKNKWPMTLGVAPSDD